MKNNFIPDEDIQKALDYLRDNASAAAQARANRTYCEDFLRVIKSQIMKEYDSLPIGAQERNAYADERYTAQLDAIREAIIIDEKHRFLMSAAQAKLDAWRTLSATERAMKI